MADEFDDLDLTWGDEKKDSTPKMSVTMPPDKQTWPMIAMVLLALWFIFVCLYPFVGAVVYLRDLSRTRDEIESLTDKQALASMQMQSLEGSVTAWEVPYQDIETRLAAVEATISLETTGTRDEPSFSSARASWYGPGFYGQRTASGETYTQDSLTFAHKTMPFGTLVVFRFGGRDVTARCNDRGPYVDGREFDLSAGTARALGFSGTQMIEWRFR